MQPHAERSELMGALLPSAAPLKRRVERYRPKEQGLSWTWGSVKKTRNGCSTFLPSSSRGG